MAAESVVEEYRHVDGGSDFDGLDPTPIQEFYKDAKVLITGSTGFLGQVLVEKLLRSCPVSTLYLMIRNKGGKDPKTRLDEMFADQFFNRMKEARPEYCHRVVVVEGDCACPDLGLSLRDKKLLMDEVNVVFHIAATTGLDENLKTATNINVRATRDLSRLAQQMTQLKAFVHMSTAYTNCNQEVIEEKTYPPPMNYKDLMEVNEFCDDFLLNYLTPRLLGSFPNTYVYTKQIAEQAVQEESWGLPTGIFRPAIIVPTHNKSSKGQMNNIHDTSGFLFGVGIGPFRVHLCDPSIHVNMVPVDMCINGLIASAWDVAEKFLTSKGVDAEFQMPVYNYESSNDQPVTLEDLVRVASGRENDLTSTKAVWSFGTFYTKSCKLYTILTFFLHYMPSMMADAILFCKGKEIRPLKTYKRIQAIADRSAFLLTKPLDYKSFNIGDMLFRMSKTDRDIFYCDLKQLDWNELFLTYPVKDPGKTVLQGKIGPNGSTWLHWIGLSMLLMVPILWFIISTSYLTMST